jgi:tetratricopeptide (TPR) repeat protein
MPDGSKFCMQCGARMGQSNDAQPQKIQPPVTKVVPAKCTNCGAALKVDPSQEAAVCPFCNTPYIIEKAIKNYNVTNNYIGTQINIQGPDAGNLIRLADNAIKAGKYSEAMGYASRALESDPKNIDAWIIKIIVAGQDIEGDRSSEIDAYVESALNNGASDDDEIKLYSAIFDVAAIHINKAIKMLNSNQEMILNQVRQHRDKHDIAAMDSGYIAKTTAITNEAIEYRTNISDELVKSSETLQQKARDISDLYGKYYQALIDRYGIYGSSLSEKAKAKKAENQRKLLSGVSGVMKETKSEGKKLFGIKLF